MELSTEDCKLCQDLTKQLLDHTLDECEKLGLGALHTDSYPSLDKKRWKKLQKHPEVTIFADRNASAAWLPVMRREHWGNPVAVTAIGQMKCSLDDVLLALVTPNVAAQRVRSFLMDRRPEQNCQLMPIVTPTLEAPFRFLAVTRFVIAQNWPFTMFKSPREMILAIATGELVSQSGRRCGYEMAQSVALQSKDPKPLPRSNALQIRVFWEQPDGSLEVYTKLVVDSKNRLPDSVKQGMLCRAVRGFWKFVPLSVETKKLWWCVKNKMTLIQELQTYSRAHDPKESVECVASSTNFPSESVANRCEFCETWLCGGSKCRTSSQLKMILSSETGIFEQKLVLCPRCVAFVRSRSAANIARSKLADVEPTSYGSAVSFTKVSVEWEGESRSSASTESS